VAPFQIFSKNQLCPEAPTNLPTQNNNTSTGGYIWVRYATWLLSRFSRSRHGSSHSVNLYDYAVSGAVCSNKISPRLFPAINADFPDIEGYEMPAFYADAKFRYSNGTSRLDIDPRSTLYTLWIGTNDLGTGCFLNDAQTRGKTIVDYLDCVYDQIDAIYARPIGGRYLVLLNIAPLQNVPLYQLPEISGLDSGYQNATETHYRMEEQVVLVNQAYEWRTMGEVVVKKRYPGMKIAVFNVHDLVSISHPLEQVIGHADDPVPAAKHLRPPVALPQRHRAARRR
jgi:hypothetical protein